MIWRNLESSLETDISKCEGNCFPGSSLRHQCPYLYILLAPKSYYKTPSRLSLGSVAQTGQITYVENTWRSDLDLDTTRPLPITGLSKTRDGPVRFGYTV